MAEVQRVLPKVRKKRFAEGTKEALLIKVKEFLNVLKEKMDNSRSNIDVENHILVSK